MAGEVAKMQSKKEEDEENVHDSRHFFSFQNYLTFEYLLFVVAFEATQQLL